MKRLLLFSLLSTLAFAIFAQSVGINPTGNNPDPSAMLDVQATDKGMLLPRLTREQRDAITNPAEGLYIYNVDDSCFNYYTGAEWILDCGRSGVIRELGPLIFQGNTANSGANVNDLVSDGAGNVYVAGSFRNTIDFGSTSLSSTDGSTDAYVLKLNAAGQVEWVIQGIGVNIDAAQAITLDGAGNVCVVGTYEGAISFGELAPITSVGGSDDIFVVKFSPAGQAQWATSMGGNSDNDLGLGVAADANGNVYAMGQFEQTAFFANADTLSSQGSKDIFIAKLDPNGQGIWAKRFGGTSFDLANQITADASGNVYATGLFLGTADFGAFTLSPFGSGSDIFTMKLNPSGLVQWVNQIGGSSDDEGLAVSLDAAGNAYFTGYFGGTATVGSDTSLTSAGGKDILVVKYDPNGQLFWATRLGGNNADRGQALDLDLAGNIYLTGSYDIATTLGTTNLNGFGAEDIFVARLDPTGQVQWAKQAGGSNDDWGQAIIADKLGRVHIGGAFRSSANFDAFSTGITSGGPSFIWSLKTDGTAAVGAQSITEVQPILDYQKIRLDPSTNVLSLSNGGTVDLSSYQDNTDQQSLSFSTPNLSIGNGNTVDLSPLQDNLGNHTASQNLQLGTFHLSGDGDNEGIAVAADGNVGIGTLAPDASAILDMQSTNRGVLIPRMTSVQRAAISNPQEGLLVYDLTSQSFWYFQQAWQEVGVNASNLLKDADEDTHVKVENNPDEDVIRMQVAGQELTRIDSANTRLKNNLLAGRAFANVSTRTINYENMGAFTASIGQIPGWQSFKPSSGGKLDFILFLVSNISDPNYTISIYEGEGANPNKLLSTTSISNPILNDWNAISFPDEIILEAGDLYTIGFSSARGIGLELVDLYPGVRSNLSPTWDFMLRVNMFVENYGFNVVNGNVGISNPNPLHPLDFGTGTGRRIALAQNSAGSDFYGFGISNSTLEIHAASTQFDDPAMVVLSSGNVGIGTTNPTRAKLQIDGSVNSNITTFGWLNSTGNTGLSPGGAADFSLWATARIAAQEFNAHSDARIKDIQGISDSKADLNTLMQLEITDYRMKDTLTKGTDTIKKVIAQQVAEVYPQAVDQNITEVVPDIYQRAEMQDGWIMLATDLQVGERVKLISKQSAAVYEVSAVEPGRFQVTASRNAPLSLSQAVFVYGREVDDFHTVDYEALSMLNVSATQEQQRLIGALKMLLEEQQKRIEKLEKEKQVQQQTFEARLQLLEASLKQSRIAATDE